MKSVAFTVNPKLKLVKANTDNSACQLYNESVVKDYNIYAIINLKSDVEALDSYFREIDLTYKDFSNVLEPIKNLIDFFEIMLCYTC